MTTDAAAAQAAPVEDHAPAVETDVPSQAAAPLAATNDPEPADAAPRTQTLESHAAARLHQLLESGVEKLPGEVSSTVSRVAVALAMFGSEMTKKEKPPTALAAEAVGLFKSLDGDEPEKQRAALETALGTVANKIVGEDQRSQALEVAEEAIGLWKKVTSTGAGLASSDGAMSLRALSGLLRKDGRDEDADETESEARRLEA
ncbi:hypothetical protein [Antribacter gilvus]|uniref:hypothetical protein n=1 Tax=Antribacter gilvus TaxID=2304675 RepID=UPI000F78AE2F|nr:hypothetical protein [Antribacter gilvus]